jgi:hypothetical protein
MSIFQSIFGGSTPANQPAPGNTNAGQGNTPGTQSNGVVPPGNDTNQNQNQTAGGQTGQDWQKQEDQSPLAAFGDVWKTDPNAGAQGNQPIFAGLDPAKVMESARKVDFSKAVSQEQLTAITEGGEGAVKAFAQAMNSVAQTVYGQSAIATAKMVEQALGKAQEQYDAKIPGLVKKLNANEGLAASNPLLQNPAIQPLVGALTEQLTRKNPNATSAEIQQQVNDYFAALGTSFAPKSKEDSSKSSGKNNSVDWSTFLDS